MIKLKDMISEMGGVWVDRVRQKAKAEYSRMDEQNCLTEKEYVNLKIRWSYCALVRERSVDLRDGAD